MILPIFVLKSSGEKELFDPSKIRKTCLRAGASQDLADRVVALVQRKARDGMSTREILRIILSILRKERPEVAARYSLRDAIFRLGPAGFEFEKYIAELLRAHGYKAELPEILAGKCVTHEVDVIVEKDSRRAMIECKFRHAIEIYISVKDVMATWARFLDLKDGAELGRCPRFDEAWIITNARLSSDALRFAQCKNMTILSWNWPKERPLPAWIDDKALYPITVLRGLNPKEHALFAQAGIMLLHDVIDLDAAKLSQQTGIKMRKMLDLKSEGQKIAAIR